MPQERISVRRMREIFRLRYDMKFSYAKIAMTLNVNAGETTVREYIRRAEKANITWPIPETIDDKTLENMLFPPKKPACSSE